MLASFLITFREGLEAFLLVGIALVYLSKMNARQHNKYIYLGVLMGLLLSLIVAVIFQMLVDQFSNEHYRNMLMAFILLFATGVLSYMAIWMQKQSKKQISDVKKKLDDYISTGNLVGLVTLSFLAVLREGFETILFFSAIMYSGNGDFTMQQGIIGAILGIVSSLVLVYLLMRGTRSLSLTPFFKYTSLLIIIIAAGLFSSAVSMLQAIEWLPIYKAVVFDIAHILDDTSLVGTFLRALFGYNSSPSLMVLIAWIGYMSCFITLWYRGYSQPKQIGST